MKPGIKTGLPAIKACAHSKAIKIIITILWWTFEMGQAQCWTLYRSYLFTLLQTSWYYPLTGKVTCPRPHSQQRQSRNFKSSLLLLIITLCCFPFPQDAMWHGSRTYWLAVFQAGMKAAYLEVGVGWECWSTSLSYALKGGIHCSAPRMMESVSRARTSHEAHRVSLLGQVHL